MNRRRIIGLGVAIATFGVAVQIPEYLRSGASMIPITIVTLAWPMAGVIAWLHRPDNKAGRLMLLIGILWALAELIRITVPWVWTIGSLVQDVWVIPFVYLLLVFPGARLTTRLSKVTFWAVIAATLLVILVVWPFAPEELLNPCQQDCQVLKAFHISGLEDFAVWLNPKIAMAFLGIIGLAFIEIRRRWRQTTRAAREGLGAVVGAGLLAAITIQALFVILLVQDVPLEQGRTILRIAYAAIALVPFGFLYGLVRVRARRARIGELVVELGEQPVPEELQASLRRALGDPDLVAAIWIPEAARYLEPDGSTLSLPEDGSEQVATFLDRRGEPLAAIVHARVLLDDPGLVESMKAATRLAVENERLQKEALAQLAEVEASRARIVRAGDEERQRIERNLHDGAQQRLVSLTLSLKMLNNQIAEAADPKLTESAEKIQDQLRDALHELRELAHGVHPAILREAGIGPALESIAERSAVPLEIVSVPDERFPEEVEATAYFIVAETASNISKHAEATRVQVTVKVEDGELTVTVHDDGNGEAKYRPQGGLSGLADRVSALGGTFHLESSPDKGTKVHASVPISPKELLFPEPSPIIARIREAEQRTKKTRELLACRGIGHSHEGNEALAEVDLDVYEGESVALVGTNGAGKTTLLRIVAGLLGPDAGTVFFDGEEITFHPAERRARGSMVFVPGGQGAFGDLSVIDNLRVFATGVPRAEVPHRIEKVFEQFPPLASRSHSLASFLSKGQQQMLALAKTQMTDPRLLVVDELTMGLAASVADELLESLEAINSSGVAILFVDQSSRKALTLAGRAYFLHSGRIEFSGSADELLGRSDIMRAVYLDRLSEELAHA